MADTSRKLYCIGEKIEQVASIVGQGTMHLDIDVWNGAEDYELEADFYNGNASIILNGLLKHLFKEGYVERTPDQQALSAFKWDRNVCLQLILDQAEEYDERVWVTRGRALPKDNIGAMFELYPKFYTGYPLDLVFSLMAGTTATQTLANTALTLDNRFSLTISDERAEVVSVTGGSKREITLLSQINGEAYQFVWNGRYQTADVPCHPLYIRWIGRLGGYEHYMMTCKQKHTASLDKIDTFERANEPSISHTLNIDVKHQVSASTGIVSRETMEAFTSILYSPLVQYYDIDKGEWIEIQVNKGQKINWNSDQAFGEIALTFNLPTDTYIN